MPVENISNTEFIKATDTVTTILLLLLNEDGTNYDLTDKTITARFLGSGKLLLEKQVSTDDNGYVVIRFDEGDYGYLGIGTIQAEIVVTNGADTKIFPNDGYLEFGVVYNTKSLLKNNVNVVSLQTFEEAISDMETLVNRAETNANEAADKVKELEPQIENMQQYAEKAENASYQAEQTLQIVQNTARTFVYVENFPRLDGETDDTARIQRAFDSAPEYATIVFDTETSYEWTSFGGNKSLKVNLNGSHCFVNPYAVQRPAIWMEGLTGVQKSVNTDAKINDRVIYLDNADGSFVKGDYIYVGDNKIVAAWSPNGAGYTGESEMNKIESATTTSVTLIKPLDYNYLAASGAYLLKVEKPLFQPEIYNTQNLIEVDPGTQSTSSPALAGKGHLLQVSYAVMPKISSITIPEGWQMHAVNVFRCFNPLVDKVEARDPFRPSFGGHGYVVKVDNCLLGTISNVIGDRARHVVDWARCLRSTSTKCISINPDGVSFYLHGFASKWIKSIYDTVVGATNAVEGWAAGNPDFGPDYDFDVYYPSYTGTGIAFGAKTGSDGIRIHYPQFKSRADYVVGITRGAKNVEIYGGVIENYNPSGTKYGLLVTGTTGGSELIENVKNVKVMGTKMKGNAVTKIEAEGTIEVDIDCDVQITTASGQGAALRVCESVQPDDLIIHALKVRGAYDRGLYGTVAPKKRYWIKSMDMDSGYRNNAVQLRAAANLMIEEEYYLEQGSNPNPPFSFSGTIGAEIANGAVVKPGFPNLTRQGGNFSATGDGLNDTYVIPHTLIGTPKRFNVTAGNTATGDIGIKSFAAFSNNITVKLNAKMPIDQTLSLNWWADSY